MIRGMVAAANSRGRSVDPYWSGVKLLLHGDTLAFEDSSSVHRTLFTGGSVTVSTAVKKMGEGSLLFNGSDASLYTGSSSDFNFGTGDFTIEVWVRVASQTNNFQSFFSTGVTSWGAGAMSLIAFGTGSGVSTAQQGRLGFGANLGGLELLTAPVTAGDWNHLALTREGDVFRIYLNGASQQVLSYSGAIDWNYGGNTVIGRNLWDGAQGFFSGYLDDLRVTVGTARTISVPTYPYPDS